jgi:hypothetical protein
MPKKTYETYVLPSNFNEMETHIIKNKTPMMEQVLSSINYALTKKLQFVEVFKFKESEFIVTLGFNGFKENIANIYEYYISTEQYELCNRVKKIEKKLITYEQKKQKTKSTGKEGQESNNTTKL